MQKKPFIPIYQIGDNNYYILPVGQSGYLVTETVIRYGKNGNKEFTEALKMLPLNSIFLQLILSALELKVVGEKRFQISESANTVEKTYAIIDIESVRKAHFEQMQKAGETKDGEHYQPIKLESSPTVEALMRESKYEVLLVENVDSFSRVIWLAKSDQYGKVTVQRCLVGGRDRNFMVAMDTAVLSRPLMSKIIEHLTPRTKAQKTSGQK